MAAAIELPGSSGLKNVGVVGWALDGKSAHTNIILRLGIVKTILGVYLKGSMATTYQRLLMNDTMSLARGKFWIAQVILLFNPTVV